MINNKFHVEDASYNDSNGQINTPDLHLKWIESSWDKKAFGFPVLQITDMKVHGEQASLDFQAFECARNDANTGLVSCRLSSLMLRESMLLEEHGFRFIETLYQPELGKIQEGAEIKDSQLSTSIAVVSELPEILNISSTAFRNERFHVDPRLDSSLADQRYCNWVKNCINHPTQQLYAVKTDSKIVAFFITEMLPDNTCYWHLNAVAPSMQGQGLGKQAWITMLNQAKRQGAKKVQTSIVARNHRVLNLYAQLNFRFPPPLMTLHWVRDSVV